MFATLDDDLFGTWSVNNQVQTIYKRKADRDGHIANVFADAILYRDGHTFKAQEWKQWEYGFINDVSTGR